MIVIVIVIVIGIVIVTLTAIIIVANVAAVTTVVIVGIVNARILVVVTVNLYSTSLKYSRISHYTNMLSNLILSKNFYSAAIIMHKASVSSSETGVREGRSISDHCFLIQKK